MSAVANTFDRLRQDEYTGENRCIPCTITNLAIAVVVGAGLGFLWIPAGVGFLGLAVAAIYFRGYLVPGTPALTKRYFPDRVLRWFDKEPEAVDAPLAGSEADIDPEPVLLELGVIEFCQGGQDLCPTDTFTSEWRSEVEAIRGNGDVGDGPATAEVKARLAELFDASPSEVDLVERDQFTLVTVDGIQMARWESRAALLGDLATLPILRRRHGNWDDLDVTTKGRLLNGTRVFLERCPECDADVSFSTNTVESCCRSMDVVTLECSECESVLLEVEAP